MYAPREGRRGRNDQRDVLKKSLNERVTTDEGRRRVEEGRRRREGSKREQEQSQLSEFVDAKGGGGERS